MKSKKRLTILIILALVLAITAISLRVLDSNEVPTSMGEDEANAGAGKVGVTILPPNVEDKLSDNSGGNSP